jgi:hypothetical protein
VCSVYEVNESEKNEEDKEKKRFIILTSCISYKREAKKFSVMCAIARVQF